MCSAQGAVKLADFGLVKQADQDTTSLTNAGRVIGTPSYMSPEQCNARPLDFRRDIYALGATLYELLTFRPPFEGNDQLDLIRRIENEPPAPLRAIDHRIPRDLETIILKALAKDPSDRFASELTDSPLARRTRSSPARSLVRACVDSYAAANSVVGLQPTVAQRCFSSTRLDSTSRRPRPCSSFRRSTADAGNCVNHEFSAAAL